MKFKSTFLRFLGIMLLLMIETMSFAQQDPMFTQYHFNTQTINPAYVGTWQSLGFVALARHQWIGMPGAPRTYTFSVQAPLSNLKTGLGLNVISDVVGNEKRMSLYGDYSHRLQLGTKTYLRLGLKFGLTSYSNNLSDYKQYPVGASDPFSQGDIQDQILPNFGVGAFLYSSNYFIGLSVPKVLETDIKNSDTDYNYEGEIRHIFLTAGYVFNLTDDVKFKPTFLTKAVKGASIQADLTANFLFVEKFWLGAMYRTGDSYGFIAQWIIDKKLRIGYAYDFTTSALKSYNDGSHEIMVSYEIGFRKKWSSPRMF